MPYITLTISKALGDAQKDALKTSFGRDMSTIPGKSESALMVHIADGAAMYFRGQATDCAYVDVRLYGAAPLAAKKAFADQIYAAIQKETGIAPSDVYLTFGEYENWGYGGSYH